MNLSKKTLSAIIIAILFFTYNTILFVAAGFVGHTATFWFSYAFMILAFVAVSVNFLLLGKNGFKLRDWLFGFPFVKHAAAFFIAELVASVIFIALEKKVSPAIAIIVQLLFLAIFLVFGISCVIAKKTITEVGDRVDEKTSFTKLLRVDAEMLAEKCDDEELSAKLKKLAEAVRYSDPMSAEALFELEKELAYTISICDEALVKKDYLLASELCDKASILLAERNKKTKALK